MIKLNKAWKSQKNTIFHLCSFRFGVRGAMKWSPWHSSSDQLNLCFQLKLCAQQDPGGTVAKGGNTAGAGCAITAPKFRQLFSFSKLLVVVLGPVSVEELVSVKDAPSARFARYGF